MILERSGFSCSRWYPLLLLSSRHCPGDDRESLWLVLRTPSARRATSAHTVRPPGGGAERRSETTTARRGRSSEPGERSPTQVGDRRPGALRPLAGATAGARILLRDRLYGLRSRAVCGGWWRRLALCPLGCPGVRCRRSVGPRRRGGLRGHGYCHSVRRPARVVLVMLQEQPQGLAISVSKLPVLHEVGEVAALHGDLDGDQVESGVLRGLDAQ